MMSEKTSKLAPQVKLANGVLMPRIGLGSWPMNDAQASVAVAQALRLGWRHVDTAENYGNESGVGQGIRDSGIPRAEIFVTSKFNKQWHSIAGVRQACEASLKRLGLDYLDLFLIHWPNPQQDRFVEAFQGLVEVMNAGLVRAIGVSNFKPHHLQKLFDNQLVPHVNQIQLDPYHNRDDIVALHQAKGIVTESWSPIGRGGPLLSDPVILSIAQQLDKTPGQIILRWHVEHGYVPLPKSASASRQQQNVQVFDFSLTPSQIQAIDALHHPNTDMLDADVFGH
jgi:2,5-diketo-D-gluconate reductase A